MFPSQLALCNEKHATTVSITSMIFHRKLVCEVLTINIYVFHHNVFIAKCIGLHKTLLLYIILQATSKFGIIFASPQNDILLTIYDATHLKRMKIVDMSMCLVKHNEQCVAFLTFIHQWYLWFPYLNCRRTEDKLNGNC